MICKFERLTVISAIRFDGSKESFDEIRAWVGDAFYYDYQTHPRVFLDNHSCNPVNVNDWIVKEGDEFKVLTDAEMSYFKKIAPDKKGYFKGLDE